MNSTRRPVQQTIQIFRIEGFLKLFSVGAIIVLASHYAFAANRYAVASGDWNQTSTWSETSGGSGGASVPTASDSVFIGEWSDITVTIPVGYAAACQYLELGKSLEATNGILTLADSSSSLSVGGDVVLTPAPNNTVRSLNVDNGTLIVTGNVTFNQGQVAGQSSRVCSMTIDSGSATIQGTLTMHNPLNTVDQTRININSAGGTLNLAGNFILTDNTGVLSMDAGATFNFNGTTAQTIPIGVSDIRYENLHVNNTSASGATLSAAISTSNVKGNIRVQSGILNNGGFAINGNNDRAFEVANGATFEAGGTTGMPTGFATTTLGITSTVDYSGTTQTIDALSYGHLTLSNSGTKTFAAGTTSIAGDMTISGTATGDATTNSALIDYNSASAQSMGALTYYDLTTSGGGTKTLSGNATVNGTLTLTSGNIVTNAYSVNIPSSGTVSRSSGHIIGNLQKHIATGATAATFEIGDTSNYTPASIVFGNVSVAGDLTATTGSGDHGNIGTSTIDASKSVNRTWTLSNSGISFTTYSATFTFVSGDIDAGANTSSFVVGKYDTVWAYPTVGTKTATSTEITGESSFSDFQIGEQSSISGTVYTDEGVTAIADGATVRLLINGVSAGTTTTTSGAYSITPGSLSAGDAIMIYVDNDDGAASDATTVTVSDGNGLANLDAYVDRLIVRHDNGASLTNALMSTALGAYSDSEILFTLDGSNNLTAESGTEIFIPAGHTYNPGANVTTQGATGGIDTRGTLTAGSSTFTVTGDWDSSSGTFNYDTSSVVLSGTGQTISGSNTFYNLTKSVASADTLTVAASSTQTINGTVTLNGASGELLTLASGSPGTHWNFNVASGATKAISYVSVSWSDASGSDATQKPINPTSFTDGGDNIDWFGAPILVVSKLSTTISDPVSFTTNPKAIPGAIAEYSIVITNNGDGAADEDTLIFADPIDSARLDYDATTGVTFTDGATSSALALGTVTFSQTAAPGPYVYDYTPVPDGDGFDGNVTSIRVETTGSFAYGGSPNPSFTLTFQVRIK